jgi:hypothetical protein
MAVVRIENLVNTRIKIVSSFGIRSDAESRLQRIDSQMFNARNVHAYHECR